MFAHKMKKTPYIILALFLPLFTFGASNLWEFYNHNLPSFADRTSLYESKFDDKYSGTAEQNTKLLNNLQNPVLGALSVLRA